MESNNWIKTADAKPLNGDLVMTKIDDENGERNVQTMRRKDGLWFDPDYVMYAYYTPTHWRTLSQSEAQAEYGRLVSNASQAVANSQAGLARTIEEATKYL